VNRLRSSLSGFGFPEQCEEESSDWLSCTHPRRVSPQFSPAAQGWEAHIPHLLSKIAEMLSTRGQTELKFVGLQTEIRLLEARLSSVQKQASLTVPIQSFSPEPVELVKPLNVVVQRADEDFTASFFDANINASGETEEEAVSNLKDMIVATFELLSRSLSAHQLGPGPRKQLGVLSQFLKWAK